MKSVVLLATSIVVGLGIALPAWASCPVINGTYVRKVRVTGETLTFKITHFTRLENGVTSYSFFAERPDEFFAADGKPHRIVALDGSMEATITIRCENGAAHFSVSGDDDLPDGPAWMWLKPAGAGRLEKKTSTDEEVNGIYLLE